MKFTWKITWRRQLISFSIGFLLSVVVSSVAMNFYQELKSSKNQSWFHEDESEKLFNEVKVLCLIMTNPSNHKTKAIHVKNTWGKRCNKLLFITSQADADLETIVVPVTKESRDTLRNKTRTSLLYVHDHLLEDFDWFIKADEDNYVIMENLRHLLYQYRSKTALFLGHRMAFGEDKLEEGYMAGGGYILSKKALQKFADIVRRDETLFAPDGPFEDGRMGKALRHSAIYVDTRDEQLQARFIPTSIIRYLTLNFDYDHWLSSYNYYNFTHGGLGCCSDVAVSFHYIKPEDIYRLEYLIYQVHPFGVEKNLTETLPRKLSLEEIIAASDVKSYAPMAFKHDDYHNLTSSERF